MNDTIPGEAGVVNDDMDLSITEVCRLLDEFIDVGIVQHVARDGDGATAVRVDLRCNVFGLLYRLVRRVK